jgi:uncharacterized membrane protein YcaP (DUF421 family)
LDYSIKYPWFEKIVVGTPIRLINKGTVLKSGLRKARITKNSLMQELRMKGLESFSAVDEAYMEPAGEISVIEKKEQTQKRASMDE